MQWNKQKKGGELRKNLCKGLFPAKSGLPYKGKHFHPSKCRLLL